MARMRLCVYADKKGQAADVLLPYSGSRVACNSYFELTATANIRKTP